MARPQKVIFLVVGESCAGKDYCAQVWANVFRNEEGLKAQVASISQPTKRAYAETTGADFDRLLHDRAYKENHRPALTAFFQQLVQLRPQLSEEQFLNAVRGAGDTDVLFITGMRDEDPVAAYSHLVPDRRLLEVYVEASQETRTACGCYPIAANAQTLNGGSVSRRVVDSWPSLFFNNDRAGNESAESFCRYRLLPFLDEDLQRLAEMVPRVPDFPRLGLAFRDVLNISQTTGGLDLFVSLMKRLFLDHMIFTARIACCEAGGFVFGSALAKCFGEPNVALALIREEGKLPPRTISVTRASPQIPSTSRQVKEKTLEMGRDRVGTGDLVLVVHDVLASGETLCAVLQLLKKAGARDINVVAVAEFPVHRGRQLLRQRGHGDVDVRSLLVFDDV